MILNLEKAREISTKTNNPIDIGYVEYGYLMYYIKIKKNDLALKSYHKSFEIFKSYEGYNTILAILLMQKSNLGQSSTNNKNDVTYFLSFYEYAQRSKNLHLMQAAANNLANYYLSTQKLTLDDSKFKEVLKLYEEAFQYAKLANSDSLELKSLELHYNINMATAYVELKPKNFKKALPYYKAAEYIIDNYNLREVRGFIYNNIGCYYRELKDVPNSIKYLTLAYEDGKNNKSPLDKTLPLDNLTQLYIELNRPIEALKYAREANDIRDQIFNEVIADNFKSLELFYETKEKNLKIEQLEVEKEYYSKINLLYFLLITLLCSTVIFIIAWFKKKQKLALQQKELLETQHELLNAKKVQLEKKALLTSIQVEEKNKLIKDIQFKILESEPINWKSVLKNEDDNDNDISKLNNIIENIDSSYIQRLRDSSSEKLTNTELKYAIYIYLNMDNQQISNIMKSDPNTVRINKYRLKQRLGLTKEQDLKEYLQSI